MRPIFYRCACILSQWQQENAEVQYECGCAEEEQYSTGLSSGNCSSAAMLKLSTVDFQSLGLNGLVKNGLNLTKQMFAIVQELGWLVCLLFLFSSPSR